ncbi:DinB family protein [Paludisphaera borealis]|uniref:DinB-like domain-containing protein n=1 Tax=Paludisphaera borealis TaxID=1387353 RepID=A0A1U7CU23_9BACT|nr:DinB family protein [Paludisphaera borealis]APW62450.1 hypothetical protein BSF38_03996 [Paludisphaera borealis]
MSPKDVLRSNLEVSRFIVDGYLADFSDGDLLVRPLPGMNHVAWQLGHLIGSERHFAELVHPGGSPPLPEGFAEAHAKEAAGVDDPSKFKTLAEYRSIWEQQRAATLAALDAAPEADLDKADPEKYPDYAPTISRILLLIGTHPVMHVGQFVAVRRVQGKPIIM